MTWTRSIFSIIALRTYVTAFCVHLVTKIGTKFLLSDFLDIHHIINFQIADVRRSYMQDKYNIKSGNALKNIVFTTPRFILLYSVIQLTTNFGPPRFLFFDQN